MTLIDSHCHIDGEQFDADRDEVVRRAIESGVGLMLNVGTGDPHSNDIRKAVEIAEKYPEVYASVGVHPHDARLYDDKAEASLVELVESSGKVIGWGEIGLDYYYDNSPRDVQTAVFKRQIAKAREIGLPIIVHSRGADDETVEILTAACGSGDFRGGVMHCFGGTPAMAETLLEIGFLISFAGNVTFKNAENLREAAAIVPLDRLLVETDCPFFTPVPFAVKRNEPSFVVHTAKFLAGFYGIQFELLPRQTTLNFVRFFNLKVPTTHSIDRVKPV